MRDDTLSKLKTMQRSEYTEYLIYALISKKMKEQHNIDVMEKLSIEEKSHFQTWEQYTKEKAKPYRLRLLKYRLFLFIFGFTFVLRLLEKTEHFSQAFYESISDEVTEAKDILKEEQRHEQEIIDMIDEDRVKYIRSIVLGLNDALVELSGALAGLAFAIANTQIISLSGLITGIAASLSMAASEYLSTHAEGRKDALKSSIYTGTAYVMVVTLLILPYLILDNRFIALAVMLTTVIIIIAVFNYFMSIALKLSFKKRFSQMAIISLGVAVISFGIGLLLGQLFGVDI